ncbi:MAG: flagellar motor switch protein FliM [Bacteroidota bacterium]
MPEILSQQEIDSLLSGINVDQPLPAGPTADEKKPSEVVVFDFRLPHRMSKNQLRTFQAVHESFAEALGSYLVSRLQTTVTVAVSSVDQLFYSEFVLSISSPSCLYVFRIQESDALAVLEISPQLIIAMVEHLMGGVAMGDKSARLITKIEQSIVKGIVQKALLEIQRAWKTVAELTFKLERYETEGDFVQIAPASEIVMVVSFEISIGSQKYLMNLCFPTFALDDVLAKLNIQHFSGTATGTKDPGALRSLTRQLGTTHLDATAVLGETSLTLRELLHLELGDVIRTNIPLDGEVKVWVGGKPRLLGRPGVSNGKVAVKITRMSQEIQQGE